MPDETGRGRPGMRPGLPQLRLDQLLDELQSRLDAARTTQDRMHSLLEAVLSVGRELDLAQVLRRIVEAAVALTDAEFGALGVIGEEQRLSEFLTVGVSEEQARRIGPLPSGHGILGELIRNPEPLRLTDLQKHPASHGFPANHPPMRSFLGVPIRVRDEVFGNLYLTEKHNGAQFDADDEAVLTTLSVAAGVAIDNARLYKQSRLREKWLEASAEISRSLLSGLNSDAVLRMIAQHALQLAQADSACVLLPSGEQGSLRVAVAEGAEAEALTGLTVPFDDTLASVAARTGKPSVTADVRGSGHGYAFPGLQDPHGPTVAVTLFSQQEDAPGALRLARLTGRLPFDDHEVELLSAFATQAAVALEMARHRAESDQLALLQDRDRIARDLHDLAIQRLFATGMTLQSVGRLIDHPEAAERVTRAVDDLDETIKIIRSTIFALRSDSPGSGSKGLRGRISETVNGAYRTLGFTPSLIMEGTVDTDVPDEVGGELLAVLAEALSNTARHARARRMEVSVTVADELVLTLTDDGVGVGGSPHTGGLRNMRSRAELLGGSFTVEPALENGTGTHIEWRVPLPHS